jgi:outer membrane cobalamin receptor
LARDLTDGTPLERRPENAGSATLTLTPTPTISIVPQVQYIGRYTDYLYGDDGYPTQVGLNDPGTIVNLTASYAVTPQYSLFAQAKNLFYSRYEAVNGLDNPRQFRDLVSRRSLFERSASFTEGGAFGGDGSGYLPSRGCCKAAAQASPER